MRKRDLPQHVNRRRLPSGTVAFQYERRLRVRNVEGRVICSRKFRRSLGNEWDGMERRAQLAAAEYQRERESLEREALDPTGQRERGTMTVAEFAEERFFPLVVAHRNTEKNYRDAWSRFVLHIVPVLGDLELRHVSRAHVTAVRERAEQTLSRSSVRKVLLIVKGLLRWSVIEEEVDRSPFFSEIHLPAAKRGLPRPLTGEQIAALLEPGVLRDWHRMYLLLGMTSGLRREEMRQLRWDQIDFQSGRLFVVEGKGEKDRVLPLFAPLRRLLESWREDLRGRDTVSMFVIPNRGDSFSWVRRSWPKVGSEWTLHQTRHTFACSYLERGGRLEVLAELLGHGDVRTTQVYTRVSVREVARESLRVLESLGVGDPHNDPHGLEA